MVETQPGTLEPALRERLLDRLGLALDTARTARRLRDEMPAELELSGLSRAEFEWITAYLRANGAGVAYSAPVYKVQGAARRDNVVWLGTRSRGKAAPSTHAINAQ